MGCTCFAPQWNYTSVVIILWLMLILLCVLMTFVMTTDMPTFPQPFCKILQLHRCIIASHPSRDSWNPTFEESSKIEHFLSPNELFQAQNVPKHVVGWDSTLDSTEERIYSSRALNRLGKVSPLSIPPGVFSAANNSNSCLFEKSVITRQFILWTYVTSSFSDVWMKDSSCL